MRMLGKEDFLKSSVMTLGQIYDALSSVPELRIKELDINKTALVIVDMINGFTREGALKSPRVEGIIPDITRIMELCVKRGVEIIAFGDCHTEASPEFGAYPIHCMQDSTEAEIVDEIKEIGGYKLMAKNSTNGFLEKEFQNWLSSRDIDTFIITGDCTDICVQQFAITLKTWFNMKNKSSRIIVPINAVDTYDLGLHNAELMNVMALFNLMRNGIEIVSAVK
jgi:nicotinamidase-related amidase